MSSCSARDARRAQATPASSVDASGRAGLPSKCFAMNRAARLAMFTILADEVAVHPRDKIIRVEVDVLDCRVRALPRCSSAATPDSCRVLSSVSGLNAGAARFGHLLAERGDEAVDEDVVRRTCSSGEAQHRRPEQRMEVDDVLADEVILLDRGVMRGTARKLRVSPVGFRAAPESKCFFSAAR